MLKQNITKYKRIVLAWFMACNLILGLGSSIAEAASASFLNLYNGPTSTSNSVPKPFNRAHSKINGLVIHTSKGYMVTFCCGFGESLNSSMNLSTTNSPTNSTNANGLSTAKKQDIAMAIKFGGVSMNAFKTQASATKEIKNHPYKYLSTQIAIWIIAHGQSDNAGNIKKIKNRLVSKLNATAKSEVSRLVDNIFLKIKKADKVVSYSSKTEKNAKTKYITTKTSTFKTSFADSNNVYKDTTFESTNKNFKISKSGKRLYVTLDSGKVAAGKSLSTTIKCTKKIPSVGTFYQQKKGTKSQALAINTGDQKITSYVKVTATKTVIPEEKVGSIQLTKSSTDGIVKGHKFTLETPGGSAIVGISGENGIVRWDNLTEIGTYTITEEENQNYMEQEPIIIENFTPTGTKASPNVITKTMNNVRKNFKIKIKKTIEETDTSGNFSPEGAEFTIYKAERAKVKTADEVSESTENEETEDGFEIEETEDNFDEETHAYDDDSFDSVKTEIDVIKADKNGNAETSFIDYENDYIYAYKETKAPKNCKIDNHYHYINALDLDFDNGNGIVVEGEIVNKPETASLIIQKIDKEDNLPIRASGFTFQLLDMNKNPLTLSYREMVVKENTNNTVSGSAITNTINKANTEDGMTDYDNMDDEESSDIDAIDSDDDWDYTFDEDSTEYEAGEDTSDVDDNTANFDEDNEEISYEVKKSDTFTTDKNGQIFFETKLPYGTYYIREIDCTGPYRVNSKDEQITLNGSTKSDKVDEKKSIRIRDGKAVIEANTKSDDFEGDFEENSNDVIVKTFANTRIKGQIGLYKYGNMFTSVIKDGDMNIPGWSYDTLKDVTFNVYSGDEVDEENFIKTITTNAEGYCSLKNLELGTYTMEEVKAPAGYTLDEENPLEPGEKNFTKKSPSKEKDDSDEEGLIHFTLKDDNKSEVIELVKNKLNETAYLSLNLSKEFDDDKGTFSDVVFGLYANQSFHATNGDVIKKDDLIGKITLNEEGEGSFISQLPYGKYYVQEMKTSKGYELDPNLYEFTFDETEANRVDIDLNNGEPIINTKTATKKRIENPKINIKETKYGPKAKKAPKTGDETPYEPYVVMFAGSVISLFWIIARKRI